MQAGREFPVSLFRVKLIRTFPSSFLFLPHPFEIRECSAFLLSCSFRVFPAHPLHTPSRMDRGELPGVAEWRPRLRQAAPGCLLGGAPWRPVCCSTGLPETHIESIDCTEGKLGAVL